jgi:hypothetical protein
MFKIPEPRHVWSDIAAEHHYGHEWLSHFDRQQRHQLVADDRHARFNVGVVMFGSMLFGLLMMVLFLFGGIWV